MSDHITLGVKIVNEKHITNNVPIHILTKCTPESRYLYKLSIHEN